MYLFECEATFEADPDAVWKAWTDVARWPEWDVSKEIAQLDGPYEPGTRGWAGTTRQPRQLIHHHRGDAGRRWVTRCPMPLGKVIFDHRLEPVAGGYVRVVKRVEVEWRMRAPGPDVRPKMSGDIAASLAALEGRFSR